MVRLALRSFHERITQMSAGLRIKRIALDALPSGDPPKADVGDLLGRMREIVSDPLNLVIERHPLAGFVDEAGCVILHNGLKVPISGRDSYYGEFSKILLINRGVHEPLEEFAFQETLRAMPDRPVMLELGAYWGHYSLWLKSVRPDAAVFMVEPSAANLRAGRSNFARNGFDGEFIQAYVARDQFTVDAFLAERGLESIDILHTDIQGFEVDMLHGARRAFDSGAVRYAFISTHSGQIHADVLAFLKAADYRIEVSCDMDRDTTACDGFILASSRRSTPIFTDFTPLGRVEIAKADPQFLVGYLTALMRRSACPDSPVAGVEDVAHPAID